MARERIEGTGTALSIHWERRSALRRTAPTLMSLDSRPSLYPENAVTKSAGPKKAAYKARTTIVMVTRLQLLLI